MTNNIIVNNKTVNNDKQIIKKLKIQTMPNFIVKTSKINK